MEAEFGHNEIRFYYTLLEIKYLPGCYLQQSNMQSGTLIPNLYISTACSVRFVLTCLVMTCSIKSSSSTEEEVSFPIGESTLLNLDVVAIGVIEESTQI